MLERVVFVSASGFAVIETAAVVASVGPGGFEF